MGEKVMPTAQAIAAEAKEIMKNDAAILTAADFRGGSVVQLQVYFWDERAAVMDIISKNDLLENWPDAGVYALDTAASTVETVFREVRRYEGAEEVYLRTGDTDADADELDFLPSVLFMESVEAICELKDKIKL